MEETTCSIGEKWEKRTVNFFRVLMKEYIASFRKPKTKKQKQK